jgi:predicted Zn-dependent peptidase
MTCLFPRLWAGLCVSAGLFVFPAMADIQVRYMQLDNGLKVILYPSKQAPTVACRLFYVTGSVHEAPGHTGIAHMLEHMLFKGTEKVGVQNYAKDAGYEKALDKLASDLQKLSTADTLKSVRLQATYDSILTLQRKNLIKYELWEAYEKAGGTGLNAFTSDLMTAYIVTLPKNKLELYLWLESDRMQHAILREFKSEHDVVMEERRMRVEDNPLGRYWESLMGVFYEAHPYRFPTIGYPSDIRFLTKQQAEEHYRLYYKPNNCILVLAGDIDTTQAMQQIKRYFAGIPRGKDFPPVVTEEPIPAGEKRLMVRRDDAKPRLDILFHTPGYPADDLYVLDILEGALSGQSGRLYKKLVKDQKIALSAGAGNSVDKYTSSFQVTADLDANSPIDKVENAVWEVLEELTQKPLSPRELQRAKNQVAARSVRSLEDMEELATELAYWEMRGGWSNINLFPARVQKVTAEQVMDVSRRYFKRETATVGLVQSKAVSKSQSDLKIKAPATATEGSRP